MYPSLAMKLSPLIALVIALCTHLNAAPANAELKGADGLFLTAHVKKTYILSHSKPFTHPTTAALKIKNYIQNLDSDRDENYPSHLSTHELSRRIAGVSHCFNIDPFVYTALIHKESILFRQDAVSPTGAVGFTQMTSIAVKEVNDQLGMRGPRASLVETQDYLNSILTGDCLAKQGGFEMFGSHYIPLWKLGTAPKYTSGSTTQARVMAKLFKTFPEYALVYGAILQKVYLSLVKSGRISHCLIHGKAIRNYNLFDQYQEAMMLYNGQGCSVQLRYQKDILSKYYPRIINGS